MKIAMLGHKRIPSREGGVEIVVEALATRMAAADHKVTVYNRSGHNVAGMVNDGFKYEKKYDYKGVHVITVNTPKSKSLNAVVYAYKAALKAALSDCDVVHFHAEGPCLAMPVAKLFGKKCVATIHGLDWKRAKWGSFATRMLKKGEKRAVKYADEIIVLSRDVQKYFEKTYGRKTVFIPNGVEDPKFAEPKSITMKYGLKGQDFILFLARIVPEKGVHTLLKAYYKSDIEVPLVIAGGSSHSEDYYKTIKDMAERISHESSFKRSKKRVILTGFVHGRELEELYTNNLFYVLPSDVEGMPISLLEAMSYGNVCLVSDIPENTDVIGEHGFTFEKGNAADLMKKMRDIINKMDKIRSDERMTRETIANYAVNKYNWDTVTKKTLNVYKKIAKSSGTRAKNAASEAEDQNTSPETDA